RSHRAEHGRDHHCLSHAATIPSRSRGASLAPVVVSGDYPPMLTIDLARKHALVAGVADDGGFGFAIAKALVEAGATVSVATWPPALGVFKTTLARGKIDASLKRASGEKMQLAKIYPLDAEFDVVEDAPAELRESRRYRDTG